MDNIQKIDNAQTSKVAPANNDNATKKMDATDNKKKMDVAHSNPQDNLQPEKVKIAGQTLVRGDSAHAKSIIQEARQAGQIQDTTGKKVDVNSAQGKGIIAQINALGDGNTARGSEKLGKLTESQAQALAKANSVLKAQGKPPIGQKPMAAGATR